MNLFSTSSVSNYWERFPVSLRLIIKARLWTAIGAGGVLYLSPIIFNSLGFSAEQIGSGITTAAFAGITTRFGTGKILTEVNENLPRNTQIYQWEATLEEDAKGVGFFSNNGPEKVFVKTFSWTNECSNAVLCQPETIICIALATDLNNINQATELIENVG